MSRQTQDYNQLLKLVALKGAIYSTSMGRVKRHSHMCKSEDQLELTLKNSKPRFSPGMRGKNRSFKGLLWGHGPMIIQLGLRPWPRAYVVRGRLNGNKWFKLKT